MADNGQNSVLFSLAHEQTNFRLFELPDDLLHVLTAENAPALELKSSPASMVNNGTPSTNNAFAVLCTADKTYHIRQVQTSNSLYVVNSSETGLTAIATCPATIELSLAKADLAQRHLRNLLVEWEDETKPMAVEARSKQSVFADIPLSDAQIELAWRQLCAFEHDDTAYVPSSPLLRKAWTAVLQASTAEQGGFETASLLTSFWHNVADEEDLPQELFDAIKSRTKAGEADAPQETAVWLAHVLLEFNGLQPQDRSDFLAAWRDLLPEQWRSQASFEAIKQFTDQSDPMSVSLKSEGPLRAEPTTTTAPTAGARKWHERLKKGR